MLPLVVLRLVRMAQSILLWQPYYVRKYFDRGMARSIGELTGKTVFDIVQFEFAFMGQYARFARSGKLVLHEHDVAYRPSYRRFRNASGVIQRFLRYCEWCRWARYEPRLVRHFDHVLTVTEQDRLLLLWLTRNERISYLPRGMHVPETLPAFDSREPRTLLFVGTFDHQPNVDAALWLARE
ncbi:MAG TPA: hypothetical protein VK569_07865, partial [Bacteroidota bacterium]|nr:hypothetical protein [Bacteroidota bacterium]